MPITTLQLTNFRNLESANINFVENGINLISGRNGSGKTSLLEAIHFIGLGRSFRTSTAQRLIRHQAEEFLIYCQLLSKELTTSVGIEKGRSTPNRIRIAEKETQSFTALAHSLPLRLIHSQSHQLFDSGPQFRRKYLDWGLFYHFETFLNVWRNFEKTLKQRNIILKEKRSKAELIVWTKEFVKHSLLIDQFRQDYISLLKPCLIQTTKQLLSMENLQLTYHSGWDNNLLLEDLLHQHQLEEYRIGHTLFGAHRADFDVKIEGHSVKHFLSRGQQKLLICAMILGQGLLLTQCNKYPIYLVDDLPSELDRLSRKKLLSLLAEQQSQVFVTAIEEEAIIELLEKDKHQAVKVFHVEHGQVTESENRVEKLK